MTSVGSGTPTGSVTFKNGSKTLGTATLSGGTAVLSTTGLSLGSNSLTATYNGDSSNSGSQSTLGETVNPATIALTLSSSPNPSQSGKLVKFTATLTSNGSSAKRPTRNIQLQRNAAGDSDCIGGGNREFFNEDIAGWNGYRDCNLFRERGL